MTIHASDPFASPDDERSLARRLRGRLVAPVSLWTAYGRDERPAGLTVTSLMVADGEPGLVLGLLDEESELFAAVRDSGRFAVAPLRDGDGQLADRFAGLLPAPGGPFHDGAWERSEFGPLRSSLGTWAGCRVTDVTPVGYATLVHARIERLVLDAAPPPALLRYRGRYYTGPSSSGDR